MEAYPAAVTFSWYFNNSEHKEAINEERFTTNGLVSTLNFAPTTNQDYGTLFCLGENAVGHQDEPCAFKIVPTGKKKPTIFYKAEILMKKVDLLSMSEIICKLVKHIMPKNFTNRKKNTLVFLLYLDTMPKC